MRDKDDYLPVKLPLPRWYASHARLAANSGYPEDNHGLFVTTEKAEALEAEVARLRSALASQGKEVARGWVETLHDDPNLNEIVIDGDVRVCNGQEFLTSATRKPCASKWVRVKLVVINSETA